MIFDSMKLETRKDYKIATKLLQKTNEYVMHVYGADSDVGIIWLGTTAQLKKTSLFTQMSQERKEKAYTILENIVKNIDEYFLEYIIKWYLYDISHVPIDQFYKSIHLDEMAKNIQKIFKECPERMPREYLVPVATDSDEILALAITNSVYNNKTKDEILNSIIDILTKLNQEGYCVCTFTDTRG